jgi:hypothetical protein
MIRLAIVFCISLTMFSAFGQSTSKYQVGTITEVKTHQEAGGATDAASYDVSVKVGETIYVVLYTPPLGEETVKYAAPLTWPLSLPTIRASAFRCPKSAPYRFCFEASWEQQKPALRES